MPSSPSFIGRAILAVVLTLGLYVLALAIVGGLLYLPYAEWTHSGELKPQHIVSCLIAAAIIGNAILLARDRFSPPGPLLEPQAHPRLFELLTEIAQATQQPLPSKVYLTMEMNTWVAHRGGIMGIGGHRVMGLGLPLLHALNLAQLRAILVHEFGHLFRGDTILGPWVYHTGAAIKRILDLDLERLSDYRSESGLPVPYQTRGLIWLSQRLFGCYGWAFLRITRAISRQQEFAADALAARSVGPRPLIEGLQRIYSTGPAFNAYWQREVVPILHHGFHPPLAAGFHHYLAVSHIAPADASCLDWELANEEMSPYDTHPTLRERIAALQHWPETDSPGPDAPAFSLLEDVDLCETRLIKALADARPSTPFQPMAWEEVGQQFWIPIWQSTVRKYARVLGDIPLRTLPALVQDIERFARRLAPYDNRERPLEERRQHVLTTLGAALAVVLHTKGWEVRALPGEDFCCQYQGALVKPFDIIVQLATGELTLEAWQKYCATLGIAELTLGGSSLEEVGQQFWIPIWQSTVRKYARVLGDIPLRTLPALVQDIERFARRLAPYDSRERPLEERRQHVLTTLGAALAVVLHTKGWEVRALPGEDFCCQYQGALVKPFDIIVQLATGELTLEAWQKYCATLGIAELTLGGSSLTAQGKVVL